MNSLFHEDKFRIVQHAEIVGPFLLGKPAVILETKADEKIDLLVHSAGVFYRGSIEYADINQPALTMEGRLE